MTQARDMVAEIETLGEKLAEAKASINRRFIGQQRVVDLTLTALLCGGHGLLIGLPGLGKTRLVETLSTVMGLHGNRVQFTPDLMPADILGSEVLDTAEDGTLSITGLGISDVDAGGAEVRVQLWVDHGTLTLAQTDDLTFTAGSNGSVSLTITGTIADINAALDAGVSYQPDADYTGPDSLRISTFDQNNTGSGPYLSLIHISEPTRPY